MALPDREPGEFPKGEQADDRRRGAKRCFGDDRGRVAASAAARSQAPRFGPGRGYMPPRRNALFSAGAVVATAACPVGGLSVVTGRHRLRRWRVLHSTEPPAWCQASGGTGLVKHQPGPDSSLTCRTVRSFSSWSSAGPMGRRVRSAGAAVTARGASRRARTAPLPAALRTTGRTDRRKQLNERPARWEALPFSPRRVPVGRRTGQGQAAARSLRES